MRDAADFVVAMTTARLRREIDERECKQRNALSKTSPGFTLRTGDVGTVVETFGPGEAFLVEFTKNGEAAKGECDWMGVLYATEVDLGTGPEKT
jgi:uncharacterized protein DUF4926